MNSKIDLLIKEYKQTEQPIIQLTIIGTIHLELEKLSKEIARKV
jgi:hypothetical protein